MIASPLVVPQDIWNLLGPLEKIALEQMQREGRAQIVTEAAKQ